jgi:hypothetical protein
MDGSFSRGCACSPTYYGYYRIGVDGEIGISALEVVSLSPVSNHPPPLFVRYCADVYENNDDTIPDDHVAYRT